MKTKTFNFFIIFTFIFTICAEICYANTADASIVSEIVKTFKEESDKWFDVAKSAATDLFYWCISLEIVYLGIKAVLNQDNMKEIFKNFIMTLLAAGFFMAVINNYQEWTNAIIFGLRSLAGDMTTLHANADNPFIIGLELLKIINLQIEPLDWWYEGGLILAMYVASFILMICFSLITAKIILVKCEVIIATMAVLILMPLGATSLLREHAVSAMRYVLAVALKLFTMQLIIGIGFSFIQRVGTSFEANMTNIAVIIGFAVVLLAISTSLPDTVTSIVSNASGGSGAGLMNSVRTISSVATGGVALGVGAVAGGVGMAKGANTARQIAKAEGATGFTGVAKGMGQAMMSARKQASKNQNPNSMRSVMEDRMAEIGEMQKRK